MPFFQRNENISIFYIDEGPKDAQAILLIPGITCDLHDWNWQVPFLLGRGFRVITPDPRTPGARAAHITSYPGPGVDPSVIDYYPQSTAEDFVALLCDLDITSVILVAHSLGTAAAYHFGSTRPDLVRALVILDPLHSVSAATAEEHLSDPALVLQNLASLFGPALYPPTVPAWHNTWITRRAAQADMAVILAQCQASLCDPEGLGRREVSVTRHGGKFKAPRLTIGNSEYWVGTERHYMPPSSEFDEIHLVEGMGNWFHQHKSEEVNEILERWFERIGLLPADK
ncbi:hypothetical protein CPLU01_13127 [Colletotrichum plurivorum]|uniref:AB hydrolase-1 domain-containing protein n=1 Tax=Colletotrichum plurivorum TaxID=2175906 RepID=A0A8H6N3Q3_9PEZI|nr:hypothetical protein CPLU01_13127 [Colletotrichum plurivorum]